MRRGRGVGCLGPLGAVPHAGLAGGAGARILGSFGTEVSRALGLFWGGSRPPGFLRGCPEPRALEEGPTPAPSLLPPRGVHCRGGRGAGRCPPPPCWGPGRGREVRIGCLAPGPASWWKAANWGLRGAGLPCAPPQTPPSQSPFRAHTRTPGFPGGGGAAGASQPPAPQPCRAPHSRPAAPAAPQDMAPVSWLLLAALARVALSQEPEEPDTFTVTRGGGGSWGAARVEPRGADPAPPLPPPGVHRRLRVGRRDPVLQRWGRTLRPCKGVPDAWVS